MKPKYKRTLNKYIKWTEINLLDLEDTESTEPINTFKPELLTLDINGLYADKIMYNWESLGITMPNTCSNPELLARYIQGKTLRDWHVTEWKVGIEEGLFNKEEFYSLLISLGEDVDKIFKGIQ